MASVLHRDHRKIVIADNVAFAGGRNISKDYLGEHPLFLDMTVQVEGPAVYDICTVFVDAVRQSVGVELSLPPRADPIFGGVDTAVIELDQRLGYPDLDRTIQNALDRVLRRCSIITPYFVPPDWFMQSLRSALERGVAVRILTAGKSDVPLAKSAGRHIYAELLELGAAIFEMQGQVLHTKAITFDDDVCVVGSYNIDAFGSLHNLELGIAAESPALVAALEAGLDARIAGTEPVKAADWARRGRWTRFVERLSYRLYRI
jgi:cardiolipin synthase